MADIANHLSETRGKRGLSAAELAKEVGVSRQTIYAIEAGSYVPNTAVALKLARTLGARVEDLFALQEDGGAPQLLEAEAALLPGSDAPLPGQPVQLCRVDRIMVASTPSPMRWYFPASDAVVTGKGPRRGRTRVSIFHPDAAQSNRLLIAGCDPGISVLARHAQAAGVDLVLAHRNSSQALELLKGGYIHVAGTHLRDETSGESNVSAIDRLFPKSSVAAISFAVWQEGIVTAHGNPKGIRGIEDFARGDVAIVNREEGAGSRLLLDSWLRRLHIDATAVTGYDRTAGGHLPAAWQVRSGAADACIATHAAARIFGLGFIPLVSERYDLVIRRRHLDLPAMQTLLDILGRSSFRSELENLGGYDTKVAGQRII